MSKEEHPQRGQIWRHTKTGHFYQILHLATDEVTSSDVVVYQRTEAGLYPQVWVRKLSVFLETTADGSPRFSRVECER